MFFNIVKGFHVFFVRSPWSPQPLRSFNTFLVSPPPFPPFPPSPQPLRNFNAFLSSTPPGRLNRCAISARCLFLATLIATAISQFYHISLYSLPLVAVAMAWFPHRFQPPPWMPSCSTYLFSPPWSPQASCDFNVFLLRSPLWSAKQSRSFNTFLAFAPPWSPQPSRDFSTWSPPPPGRKSHGATSAHCVFSASLGRHSN